VLIYRYEYYLPTEEKKEEIKKAVEKAVKEYGKTLELLGKE